MPYAKEINKQKISADLASRIYQFYRVHQIIQAVSVFRDDVLKNFGQEIGRKFMDYMNDALSFEDKNALENAAEKYPDLLDAAEKQNDETLSIEEKLSQMRSFAGLHLQEIAWQNQRGEIDKISAGLTQNVALSLYGTLFAVIDRENNKKINAEELTEKILNGNLVNDKDISAVTNVLQGAKSKVLQQLKKDWQTYESMQTPNAAVEGIRTELSALFNDSKQIDYEALPELRSVRLCIRDDFSATDGSKQKFLKMMGYFLDTGHYAALDEQYHKNYGTIKNKTNYAKFAELIKQEYAPQGEDALNEILGIDAGTGNIEKLRLDAFVKKSTEIYFKFLAGILVKKQATEEAKQNYSFNYENYIKNNVAKYIEGMKEGKNLIAEYLNLADESKSSSLKEMKDDTADQQIISVHHIIPVASALQVYTELNPQIHDSKKMQTFAELCGQKAPHLLQKHSIEELALIGLGISVFPDESNKDAESLLKADKNHKSYWQNLIKNKAELKEIYNQVFSFTKEEKLNMQKEILQMINNIGNHALPIGINVHQGVEPNGNLLLEKNKENLTIKVKNEYKLTGATSTENVNPSMVLTAGFTKSDFDRVIKHVPSAFRAGMEKFNKSSDGKNVKTNVILKLRDTKFIDFMRKKLNQLENTSPQEILQRTFGCKIARKI